MIVNVGCPRNIHLHLPFLAKRRMRRRKMRGKGKRRRRKKKRGKRIKEGKKGVLFQCQCLQLNTFIVQPPLQQGIVCGIGLWVENCIEAPVLHHPRGHVVCHEHLPSWDPLWLWAHPCNLLWPIEQYLAILSLTLKRPRTFLLACSSTAALPEIIY